MKKNRIKRTGICAAFILVLLTILSGSRKLGDALITGGIKSHRINTAADLDVLLDSIGNRRIVLLGEATHGTAEFYNWRTEISKRLIEEKGFQFIAVEGEWADSYRVNAFVKGKPADSAATRALLQQYNRWPTWMWANEEVARLVTWLNVYNQNKPAPNKAGFYGLDVYCLWESMTELMPYLRNEKPELVAAAKRVHNCFQPYSANARQYAYAVANAEADCQSVTQKLWASVSASNQKNNKTEDQFAMEQNALVALNGEQYYRSMRNSSGESWNVRDRHMMQTLQRLLELHGPNSRAIVWQHNTHVGDARYTDMQQRGLINVGQLARETYGETNVFAVGFSSFEGKVIAAGGWGQPMRAMNLPPAKTGSLEEILHRKFNDSRLIFSKDLIDSAAFQQRVGHRAVGVVYDARNEAGNYVPTQIQKRYDALFYIDRTTALHPLKVKMRNEPPDTYPSGY